MPQSHTVSLVYHPTHTQDSCDKDKIPVDQPRSSVEYIGEMLFVDFNLQTNQAPKIFHANLR